MKNRNDSPSPDGCSRRRVRASSSSRELIEAYKIIIRRVAECELPAYLKAQFQKCK